MLTLLALLTSPCQAQTFADLVKTHALTASDEHKIGAGYIELSGWLYGQVDDVEMVRRVEGITRDVVAASDRPDLVVNVIVSDTADVNASAYPGGYLVVNRGAVELFDDEELAFVLAHEISHVLLRHYANGENLVSATQSLSVANAAMAAEDRAKSEKAAEELAIMMARYSRQLEFEADLYGLLYAVRAGAPMDSGARAMAKLASVSGPIPEEYKAYSDHPEYSERVAELTAGAETMKSVHRKFDVGLSSLSAGMDELAVQSFQEFLTLYPRSSAGWTNLAAAHLRQGLTASSDPWFDRVPVRVRNDVTLRAAADLHMDRAKDACAKSVAIDPERSECWTMLGVMARHAEKPVEARKLLARAAEFEKEPSAAILVDQGIVEAVYGKPAAAQKLFEAAQKLEPDDPYAAANLATLFEKSGKPEQALPIWTKLYDEGKLVGPSLKALQRLGTTPATKAPTGPVALGGLSIGSTPEAATALLGPPNFTDGDEIGLTVYMDWSAHGVGGIFSAGGLVGLECSAPCKLELDGLGIGEDYAALEAKLGVPTEKTEYQLYGAGGTAYYVPQGLTVWFENSKITGLSLWAP